MTLFANEREANLASTNAMIEDALINLGHVVDDCRRDRNNCEAAWTISKGSATIDIDLVETADAFCLRLKAVVMSIDEKVDKLALFEHLLTLNEAELSGPAFGLAGDQVILRSERSTLDIDPSELRDLVSVLRNAADAYDGKLVDRFGGRLGG